LRHEKSLYEEKNKIILALFKERTSIFSLKRVRLRHFLVKFFLHLSWFSKGGGMDLFPSFLPFSLVFLVFSLSWCLSLVFLLVVVYVSSKNRSCSASISSPMSLVAVMLFASNPLPLVGYFTEL